MADVEKVISGLKCHCHVLGCCECPYRRESIVHCSDNLAKDALELLETNRKNDYFLSAMEYIAKEYGDQGEFDISGKQFSTDELIHELQNETQVGFEFKKMVTEIILTYLMKFKG